MESPAEALEAEALPFEDAVEALENVVQSLEMGDTTLERSLELFEQGVRLARRCNGLLNSAEGRIEKLVQESDGNLRAEALDSGGELG